MSQSNTFFSGITMDKIELEEVLNAIPKGAVVFLGEQHGRASIQKAQLEILNGLRNRGHKIHIGMEFLDYTQQSSVNDFRSGLINESEFLKKISWGSIDFNFYRDQILFPKGSSGETTFAINTPRWLSGEVSKKGFLGIDEEAKKLFPPQLQLGRDSYKKRFSDLMSGHVTSPEAMQKYFESQSLWDDTMAWQISTLPVALTDTVVIIVGQFHIEYGGGLPFQLQQRFKDRPVITIEQLLYYDDEEVPFKDLMPSPTYGPMSDYLLISVEKS